MEKRRALASIVMLSGIFARASGADARLQTGIAPPTRIPDVEIPVASPAGEAIGVAQMPRSVRRAVVADAAKRFNVAQSQVVLARAERVTWNDGSLGCAEPSRIYAQVLVPGFRVIAKTSAGDLAYHTDSHSRVVSCSPAPRGSMVR